MKQIINNNAIKLIIASVILCFFGGCSIASHSYAPINRTIEIEKQASIFLDLSDFEKEQIENQNKGLMYYPENTIAEFKDAFTQTVGNNFIMRDSASDADYVITFRFTEKNVPSCCGGWLSAMTLFLIPEISSGTHTMTGKLKLQHSDDTIASFQSTSKGTVILHITAIPFVWTNFLLPSFKDDFIDFAKDIAEQTLLYFEENDSAVNLKKI